MRISFGQHVFDTDRRQLECGDGAVHLSPKAFAVLDMLIAERPKPVAKRVLLDRVWPDVVVEEQNVKNTIVEIRSALQEDARFIRTVQRLGYAFSGEATEETRPRFWLYAGARPVAVTTLETYVGRDPSCAVCVDELGVSRRHARLVISNESVLIEDLGSKNGTWVYERQITEPTILRDGDRIRVGAATFTFRLSPAQASTETAPPLLTSGGTPGALP